MANFEGLQKRVNELLEICLKACEDLDATGKGVANYTPDNKSVDILRLCLNLFNIHIAIADGALDDKEIELLNTIGNTHFSRSDFEKIIDKTDVRKDEYGELVPVILRTFVDADNYEDKSQGGCPLSVVLYDLIASSGVYVMAVNDNVGADEYNRLMAYLRLIYGFIKQNLKYGYSDMKRPTILTKSILDLAEVEVNRLARERRIKRVTGADEEDETYVEPETETSDEDDDESKSLQDLIDELNSMIGLDEVKYEVTSLMNLFRIKAMREQMGLKMPPISMHLVFSGNPGTGKTTVARLLARIYKKIGVLSKGQLVEVDRAGLVGGYVGQTALKTADVINSALGGVLFIDEAYSLTPENSVNDYGAEAIDTIVKGMEDNRKDLVVIVAGYPELMQRFLSSNPGLKSRFNKFIHFRDYTPDELTQIFSTFCEKSGYRASDPALSYVKGFFEERCLEKEANFANAREVRNLFEYALSRQANRAVLISNPTQNNLTLLKKSDVSGEEINLGKQQYMAQLVINDLTREKRHGLGMEYMDRLIDEFELPASAEDILYKKQIGTIKDLLDCLDGGQSLLELMDNNEDARNEVVKGLSRIGFEE